MAPGGFEALADERGFHVLYPQQKSDNNPVGCFNWAGEYGDPANLERGKGENRSIISMVIFFICSSDNPTRWCRITSSI